MVQAGGRLPQGPDISQHSRLPKSWLTGGSLGTYSFVLKASVSLSHGGKRGASRNDLFWDWINCVLHVLGHFFPWRVKGEEKPCVSLSQTPLRSSGDCVSVGWGVGMSLGQERRHVSPSPSLFSLCRWRGPLVPAVGIFTVSWALQAGT